MVLNGLSTNTSKIDAFRGRTHLTSFQKTNLKPYWE